MAAENPNVTILKKLYQDWHETKGQSVDSFMELMADTIAFSSLANGAQGAEFTKPCACPADVRGYFDGLLENWTMLHYRVDDYIADGDRVVAVGHTAWTNKATGKTCETPKVDVWSFSDGRITSFAEYYDTAALFAAAT